MPNKPTSTKEKEAWYFSESKHSGQVRRFLNISYFEGHVQKVNGIVKQYNSNIDILCSALLHDVIEDCYDDKWEGYIDIKEQFGEKVANIVMELTSDSKEIRYKFNGDKAKYLINKMMNMSDDALVVKLVDRLQNISDAFTANDRFREKYYYETKLIMDSVSLRDGLNNTHKKIILDIVSKLGNIKSIFNLN